MRRYFLEPPESLAEDHQEGIGSEEVVAVHANLIDILRARPVGPRPGSSQMMGGRLPEIGNQLAGLGRREHIVDVPERPDVVAGRSVPAAVLVPGAIHLRSERQDEVVLRTKHLPGELPEPLVTYACRDLGQRGIFSSAWLKLQHGLRTEASRMSDIRSRKWLAPLHVAHGESGPRPDRMVELGQASDIGPGGIGAQQQPCRWLAADQRPRGG